MSAPQLVKDNSIIDLLAKLEEELGEDFYDVVDHWSADIAAIGIASPTNHNVLVYITTLGYEKGNCEAHLELPSNYEDNYINAGIEKNLNFNSLKNIIESHFGKNT